MNTSAIYTARRRILGLIGEFSIVFKYIFLAISGIAAGLIFNAVAGYSYSSLATDFIKNTLSSPFSSTAPLYDIFGNLLSFSLVDTVFVVFIFLSGFTYLCQSLLSAGVIIRGFLLGTMTGAYATAAAGGVLSETAVHPIAAIVFSIITLVITSVLILFYASFVESSTSAFRSGMHSEGTIIFSRKFLAYILGSMTCFGSVLLFRALLSLLLQVLMFL